jgi:hypothetical protein
MRVDGRELHALVAEQRLLRDVRAPDAPLRRAAARAAAGRGAGRDSARPTALPCSAPPRSA